MYQIRSRQGFTLIEMMVVVAITAIFAVMTISPYLYYSNLARVRVSYEKVQQAFSLGRSLVVAGETYKPNNVSGSVGFWLEKNSSNIQLRVYPYNINRTLLRYGDRETYSTLKTTVALEDGVLFSQISPEEKVLVFFSAPNALPSFYRENGEPITTATGVALTIGFHGAQAGALSRNFTFAP